ncbi:hypothetical protein [Robinsoniella sp. KNHs210]|uniref:hypothetical protein n=1 Tax=Robinsoniella sp. KNHs210 TaxID=1469950 RepID=UPI000694228D|nr:hypothetical protein [Robinsoniella sp. KNHs210]
MINTSTEYKKAIQKDREFRIQDTITFKDGTKQGKTITLSTGDFMSYSINGATSSSGKFDIGAAVIKKYTAVLNNMNDKFSEYDFEGADIRSYIGLKLEDGSWEVLSKGTYRVCKARSKDLTISIEAYDYMLFFDQPYSKSKLSYPATINEIIADACLCCQMTYNAQTIQNGRFTVEKRPEDEALTFRDIISYCAQIMCCYARISNTNALEFGWYDFSIFDRNDNILDGGNLYDYTGSNADGGNFKSYSGDITDGGSFTDQRDFYHLFLLGSQDIDVADIVITGVKATADNSSDDNNDKTESFLYGKEDYALSLEGNPLIQKGHAEEVAGYVGPRIVGRRFRPLSITSLSDPSIEEGDVAYITDRKNDTYKTVITNTTFSMGGYQSVICDAETKTENNYTRYGAETKLLAQAKKDIKNEISQYDIATQQLNSIALNALGYYETIAQGGDGSTIRYMHDKPEMKDSEIIYKISIDGFFISNDGGKNYYNGYDKYGNAVLNSIEALRINADRINAGVITGVEINNGNGTFKVDSNGNTITNNLQAFNAQITGGNIQLEGSIEGKTPSQLVIKDKHGEASLYSDGIVYQDKNSNDPFFLTSFGAKGFSFFTDEFGVELTENGYYEAPIGEKVYGIIISEPWQSGYIERVRISQNGIMIKDPNDSQTNSISIKKEGSVTCNSLVVRNGNKSKCVETSNYGDRLLYCYETPSPLFGDIGRATLDNTGTCYIYMEDVFTETIDFDYAYNVFTQKYGEGDLWVSELQPLYFVIKGTPGMEFVWEVKAKQVGHGMDRLESYLIQPETKTFDYTKEAVKYMKEYEKELLNYE